MPAYTLAQAVTEMQGRGFGGLPDARLERMLRAEYEAICEAQPWPFLLASTTGSSPLTIADLRTIESVVDQTNERKLLPEDFRNLSDRYPLMDTTGAPAYYYLEWSAGSPVVKTYPLDTVTLSVRYYKVPPTWSSGAEPLLPDEYQEMIVDRAVARALRDTSQYEAAAAAEAAAERTMGSMLQRMFGSQHDRPVQGQIVSPDRHGDW